MLTGSILFYSFGEPYYLFLILCSILVNFVIGLGIENFKDRSFEKKTLLILSLLYNFGFLLFLNTPTFLLKISTRSCEYWTFTGGFTRLT